MRHLQGIYCVGLRVVLSALIALPQPFPAYASLTEFETLTPLPKGYIGHSLLAHDGRLYNIGGLSSGGILLGNRVYVTDAAASGLSGWTETAPLPQPSLFHASAIADGHIFVLGGQKFGSGLQPSAVVVSAPLLSGGGVGSWTPTTPLPTTLFLHSVSVWNGRIYVLGGWSAAGLTNTVYSADVLANGQLGPWTPRESLPEAVYTHSTVQNGHIYVLGGVKDGGSTVYNGVYFSEILGDGSLGPWVATTFLPEAVSSHASVLYGRVFVTGGWLGDQPTNHVRSAAILPDGHLGDWQAEPDLPVALYRHSATVSDGRLYVSGGSNGSATMAGVYALELPPVITDILPPRTTISTADPKFGADPIFITNASHLTLAAIDDKTLVGDGLGNLASTQVSLDGGAYSPYAVPFTIAAEGYHQVSFYSSDQAGNSEAQQSAAFAVDLTAPQSTLAIGSPMVALETGERIVSNQTPLNVNAADPISNGVSVGVASVLFGVDGGALLPVSGDFFLPNVDGAHAVATQASDHLGNAETTHSTTLFVDATAPVTTVAAAPAPYVPPTGSPIYAADNVLTFSANDLIVGGIASGVNMTEYQLDSGEWTPVEGELTLEEGVHSIVFRSADAIGNLEAAKSASFRVDATAPVTEIEVGSPVMSLFGRDLITPQSPISLSAEDAASAGVQSGVKKIVYSIDGGADQIYSAPFNLSGGGHSVSFGAIDNAGNVEDRQSVSFSVASFLSDSVAGFKSVTLSGGAKVIGNVRSNGAFKASGKSDVEGNVTAMTISLTGKSEISGTATQGAATLPAAIDLVPFQAAAAASNNNAAIPSAYLQNGALVMSGKKTLTLPAGDYYLTGISLSGQAEVELGGPVNIFATGAISISGGSEINKSGLAEDLWIFSNGASANFTGHSRAAMHLYAPSADVSMSGNGSVAGRLLGDEMTLSGHTVQPSTVQLPKHKKKGNLKKLVRKLAKKWDICTSPKVGGQEKKISVHKKGKVAPQVVRKIIREVIKPLAASWGGKPKVVARVLLAQTKKAKDCENKDLIQTKETSLAIVDLKGKEVRAFDRSAVVIPEGALPTGLGVSVSVQEEVAKEEKDKRDEDKDKKGIIEVGKPVEYGPHGTQFNRPVTLELPYIRSQLPAGIDERSLCVHYWNQTSGQWESLNSVVDTANQLVKADTTHFSVYQLFSGSSGNGTAARSLGFGDVYSFPNPAKAGQVPTIHVEAGSAERVEIRIFDISGELKHSATVTSAAMVDDGSGPESAFEYRWEAAGVGAGVYILIVTAYSGAEKITKTGKLAIIR